MEVALTIVITGGAGFAGSHIVDEMCRAFPDETITVIDKMTYAGDIRNISGHLMSNRVRLMVGDVADLEFCQRAVAKARLVIHAAAESHVDNSFGNSLEFTRTNVLGTHCLLEACRVTKVPRIVHISTDEVYGEVIAGAVDEKATLLPTNPYSSSKAAAEMVVRGYIQSYHVPIVTVRANNLYGIRQFPEKIIPRFLCQTLVGDRLQLHGTGKNRRHYLSVIDFACAVRFIAEHGDTGEIYNIGTHEEYSNIEVATLVSNLFGIDTDSVVDYVADRPFNDARYSITWDKLSAKGWKPQHRLSEDLPRLALWYEHELYRYPDLFGNKIQRPLAHEKDSIPLPLSINSGRGGLGLNGFNH
jgi:dTDP-glucose 4,6-dehydratase